MASSSPNSRKLALIPLVLSVGAAAVFRILYSPFRKNKYPVAYRQDVIFALVRALLSGLPDGYAGWSDNSTDKVYDKELKSKGIEQPVIDLEDGSKGHWFGPAEAKYVYVFFHGGGFEGYATPAHAKYQLAFQNAMKAAGIDLSIFSVTYSLSHQATYPRQLQQATAALRYLIESEMRDPQTIIVGGDSAGANLVCELLLHLAKPHTEVTPLVLSGPLKACVLLSPWASFDLNTQSFKENAESDYLSHKALARASAAFLGNPPRRDEYSEPASASPELWEAVAKTVCDEIFIWGGGAEILVDSIRKLSQNVAAGYSAAGVSETTKKAGEDRVVYVETPGASHEEQIMKYSLVLTKKGEETTSVEQWVCAKL